MKDRRLRMEYAAAVDIRLDHIIRLAAIMLAARVARLQALWPQVGLFGRRGGGGLHVLFGRRRFALWVGYRLRAAVKLVESGLIRGGELLLTLHLNLRHLV